MPPTPAQVRLRITLHGAVQGVGFRPFVHRLATSLALAGRAHNHPDGLVVEVEGPEAVTSRLVARLRDEAPPRAVVEALDVERLEPLGETTFRIDTSHRGGQPRALVPPDIATCDACLAELRDPRDRRYRYPFVNCTDCGPRLTIVRELPYDRHATTMAGFALCPRCAAEYADPADRRFHAQPTACPACGPRLRLVDRQGAPLAGGDPVAEATRLLEAGQTGAVKGLGGFHLACHAGRADAVAALRRRKHRPHKPFAVMARDLAAAARVARVGPKEAALLQSWRRPIVLLEARPGALADGVGGSSDRVGVMLPYTPLHALLLEGDYPALVMTSGNERDAPIARGDDEALATLGRFADFFLLHDRPIHRRADDSVARVMANGPVLLRRSRGWVPEAIRLPRRGPAVIAVGGDLKSTCAVTRDDQAIVSPHVGDLAHPATLELLAATLADLPRLLGTTPALAVHDLHPDYRSTRLAAQLGLPTLALQHHHAHALSCLAEHGWDAPALAIALDGTGHGTDGQVWGGELLRVDGLACDRLAHLTYLPLPGGDRAAEQPWRMAAAVLAEGDGPAALPRLRALVPEEVAPAPVLAGVLALCRRADAGPLTSSAGRLFDAAASLLGLCHHTSFEGQAAMLLEHAASRASTTATLPHRIVEGHDAPLRIDLRESLRSLAAVPRSDAAVCEAARVFHNTLLAALIDVTVRLAETHGLDTVALTGGVLQNRLVHDGLVSGLGAAGLRVLTHREVPPNDGGLCLGQAWAGVLHLTGTSPS